MGCSLGRTHSLRWRCLIGGGDAAAGSALCAAVMRQVSNLHRGDDRMIRVIGADRDQEHPQVRSARTLSALGVKVT